MRHEQGKCRAWSIVEQLEPRQLLAGFQGWVFNDATGEGLEDSSSLVVTGGISGVTVFIDANEDGSLSAGELSSVTDSEGFFHFDNLPLGRYVIRQVAPAGLLFAWFTTTYWNEQFTLT